MGLLDKIPFPVIRLPRAITKLPGGEMLELYLRYAPSFKGRASRAEWFGTLLFTILLYALFIAIGPWTIDDSNPISDEPRYPFDVLLVMVITYLPLLSASVRRLHDTRRRWWGLFVVIMPYVGWLVLFVILMLNPDKEENEFGPPPPE